MVHDLPLFGLTDSIIYVMELSDSLDEARFRSQARAWIEATLPTLAWPEPVALEDKVAFWRPWQRALSAAGYAGLTWPEACGGAGLGPVFRAILAEELDDAGAPEPLNIIGEGFAGPTIVDFGTDAQRERHLRAILTGDEIWCQLFSEPESGSDLASLRTTATKTDGGWLIRGQKIWTSRAQIADLAILLARTGGGPRHKGISFFLLPMDSDGITVRPLRHMLGDAEFNEVFLDDVFVEDENLVGAVDDGWRIAMATLAYERVAIATGRVNTRRAIRDIVADVKAAVDDEGRPLSSDPRVRDRVADLWARALVHYLIGQRVVATADEDGPPGPVTSIGKLYATPLVEDLADFRLSLAPFGGQLAVDSQDDVDARWTRLANQARGTAIAGGSTFIQRNIVAERILGMPRSGS
jgi:alkylation response protein AidB-like acyl-CoA dehydrogenase